MIQAQANSDIRNVLIVLYWSGLLFVTMMTFESFTTDITHFVFLLISNIVFLYLPLFFSSAIFTKGSLEKSIIEEKKRMCGNKTLKPVFDIATLYNPSPLSLFIIVMVGIVINLPAFLFLPYINNLVVVDVADKADFFNNFIAVHAGVGSIIFALLIFVAESLRDDSKERASVLLRESLLFPLTLLEIITLLALLAFNYQNLLICLPIFIVGCLTIYSLYRLIKVLLSPYAFNEKRLKLLKDRVRASVDRALNERIGNNIVHKILSRDDFALTAGYFLRRERRGMVAFKLNKYGIIDDINLDALEELGELIESRANELGLSFFESKPKMVESSQQTDGQIATEVVYYTPLRKWDAQLTKFYRQRIDTEDDVVLALSKQLVAEDIVFEAQVNELLGKVFTVRKEDNFSEEIKLELESLRDQFVEAVQQLKISKIEYHKGLYLSLVEVFLDLINQCGGGYTPEQARKEASSAAFKEGWPEIEWLDDHIRDIYKASIATKNKEIIHKVAFLPFAIAIRGIRSNDHFIFQKFIRYARSLHFEALEEGNELIKDDLIEHSITWLREVCEFHIELDMDEHPERVEFARQILIELQLMLKYSFEKNDIETFSKILDVMSALLKRFRPSRDYPNSEHLTWEVERATDEKVKAELTMRLEELKKRESAEKKFTNTRAQIFFGFTAWIFKEIRAAGDDFDDKKRFFDTLKRKLPNDIVELTEIFVASNDHDRQDRYGWDWWDIVPNGEVQTISVGANLEDLYIYLVLELLTRKTDEEVAAINLVPHRSLAFLAESNSAFFRKLDDLSQIHGLDKVISEDAKLESDDLKNLLERAKSAQEDIERVEVRERELNPEKIDEFWELFKKEYFEHATIRTLFKLHDVLVDKSDEATFEPQDVHLVGYNQIDNKEGFFKNWYVHYVGWGEQYGEGFARSENASLYEKFVENLTEKRTISFNQLIPTVQELVRTHKYEAPCLLSPYAYSMELRDVRLSKNFIPRWQEHKGHKGYDKLAFYSGLIELDGVNVPVFNVIGSKRGEIRDACLVDLKKVGELVQYPPIKTEDDKQFQRDIFLFKVIDLNSDDIARNKILADNPSWLDDKEDKEAYLRGKVLLNIYSKSQMLIKDVSAGVHLTFIESEEQLNDI